jgi:Cu-Zn family superoxide dismutase
MGKLEGEMRREKWIVTAAAGLALGGFAGLAALAQQPAAPTQPPPTISASFAVKGPMGQDLGSGKITQGTAGRSRGIVMRLDLKGLTPGWHGVHFHAKADCSAADFTSAGAHIHGADGDVHGLLAGNANHTGDLPNVYAAADGTAHAELFSPFVLLAAAAGDDRPALQDADGSAVIVHAGPDDHYTSPSGGSGARAGCGLITR